VFALVRLPVIAGWVRLRGHADANLPLGRLGAFGNELHGSFTRRADARFELGDALLSSQTPFLSLPHLRLEPTQRRGGVAPMPPWPAAASRSSGYVSCWSATCHLPTRRCSPLM
jgi:hypothetical protein